LHAKLGFAPGMVAAFVALPPELAALTKSVPFATVVRADAWQQKLTGGPFDVIHAFTKSRADLAAGLPRLQGAIKRDGMIWISWPKKASGVASDVSEDIVRAEALQGDLVDIKVAAVDAVWSGLKLVIRKERR
jgi:hypothetical protein